MIQSRFKNKTILITGAGTGMGRAAAKRMAQEKARLVLIGRRKEMVESLAQELRAQGCEALASVCDISDEAAVIALAEDVSQKFGRIDGLFANAGVLGAFTPIAQSAQESFEKVIPINLIGTFHTIRQCLPMLDGGSILINASWTANAVMPGAGIYAATKGALLAMMRTLAVEVGPRNIRVNAINPGIIMTPMADEALPPGFSKRLASHTPLGRNGAPEDVAGTVAWLLSEDAQFVTGQEITVDGGYTIGGVIRG